MKPIHTFAVVPKLPPELERLRGLAHNLRWAWNHDAVELFQRLDPALWESTNHNPVLLLGTIDQIKLEHAARDEGFRAHLQLVVEQFDEYMNGSPAWYVGAHGATDSPMVAYFSAEFGVTECLSIFAGGLGLLAGDHLKSASDLGIPLVAVGLLYQQGYFQQRLNDAGWQEQEYIHNDFHNLPLTCVELSDGAPLKVEIPFPSGPVYAHIWKAQVGRVTLYLLDTNAPENGPGDRGITDQLYGGDLETRIRQELVLGIGGARALAALGLTPHVYHMNEGHAAFLALERIRSIMERDGLTFADARELVTAGLIFTTHTPVPAGHDAFPPHLVERYLKDYAPALGLSWRDFMALGRVDPNDDHEPFGMTILALRLAAYSNGVSRLHGAVSREMWQTLWPGVPVDDIPIDSVTNGVHLETWISHDIANLYDRHLGPRWRRESADETVWRQAEHISNEELWDVHERRRERLITFSQRRLVAQTRHRGVAQAELEALGTMLDPQALTIGFARRFATYKRATLLLHDPDRLARILNAPDRPAQIIMAGKAHPRDDAGKELIRQVLAFARQEPFRGRLIFLENYDPAIARALVQGCDVWLNTPRRPFEASGTSGMKAAANGVLNVSTLDGWWAEAWDAFGQLPAPIGWAIGSARHDNSPEQQDAFDAESLYATLERDVVPLFYERGADRVPHGWVARMKSSINHVCRYFNTHRMVYEYTERFYLPAARRHDALAEGGMLRARALADWRERVERDWPVVRVVAVEAPGPNERHVGDAITARARVHLGELQANDVAVELVVGRIGPAGDLCDTRVEPMIYVGGDGVADYAIETATSGASGLRGLTVRVTPRHPDLAQAFLPGKIAWAE